MKRLLLIISYFLLSFSLFATHNRAGEIIYRQISEYTYEITLYTYTYTKPGVVADRPELTIHWGDNTSDVVPRSEELYLPYYYKRNKYVWKHTFPGPGVYEILAQDPNRNDGVKNITNSVRVMFAIKTTLKISSSVGFNNTPKLLNPPYDKAFVNTPFVHNPAAYDPDGDSISYKLVTCLGENGEPLVDVYSLPQYSKELYVDSITGDLVWDAPVEVGIYNIAIAIEEWRDGVKIGQIVRDMQIEVFETDNNPPIINPLPDYCVLAGTSIDFDVVAWDPDTTFNKKTIISDQEPYDTVIHIDTLLDGLKLTGTGGPLIIDEDSAHFPQPVVGRGTVRSHFSWKTTCAHVRKTPYHMMFKVEDGYLTGKDEELHMFDYENVYIRVIAPPPENLNLEPTSSSITLNWDIETCPNAIGYKIYRKINRSGFVPDSCETGVPGYTGYELIAEVEGIENTTFTDNNNEEGLWQGVEYCYMITAFFADGAESYASNEICTVLERGIPVITNVSVNHTDTENGSIYLAWAKPSELDTIIAPGPYKYLIYRSEGFWGENFELIDSLEGLDNTVLIDTMINTKDVPYSYKVELWNVEPSERFLIGAPQIASSIYLHSIAGVSKEITLNFNSNTPWTDTCYVIYRLNETTNTYDSIGSSKDRTFTDTELENSKEYCYKIHSIGYYSIDGVVDPIINFSQEDCNIVSDTIPPCIPPLQVRNNCDIMANELSWEMPNKACANDLIKYRIFYANHIDAPFKEIGVISNPQQTSFTHYPDPVVDSTLAGCYAISAIDSFLNETPVVNRVCVDACMYYKLPNVFTPNGKNPYFTPIIANEQQKKYIQFVDKVDVKIYNRWGQLLYQSDDPFINWDGKDENTGKQVPDGVYYYVCEIYERRISGIDSRQLVGFVQVFTNNENTKP
ncbi:MAG: hypothetical protein CSB01_01545 [Bacteroidia bacterium]|nr:MAG: hypothetical protein CSB01_01545 [Bacteroidia bacterium]